MTTASAGGELLQTRIAGQQRQYSQEEKLNMERSVRCGISPGVRWEREASCCDDPNTMERKKSAQTKAGEGDRVGYWEHPSLILFVEKNRGAEVELLTSLAWRGEYWNGGVMSSMATTIFGGFGSGSGLAEKDKQGGKEG
jgi:hypothetical protein